jgi:hypothetical protein
MAEPPLASVNQPILFPADVAFKFVDEPQATEEGDAVTGVGAAKVVTVTVTGVRIAETQTELA